MTIRIIITLLMRLQNERRKISKEYIDFVKNMKVKSLRYMMMELVCQRSVLALH